MPNAPLGPEAALMPNPEPAQALAATPLPAPPEVVELPPQQAQIPEAEASGQHFQDPAPAKPPKLYLPVLVSTDGKRQGDTRISGCAPLEEPEERALLQKAQSSRTPSDPMDCSPPGSSIHGIFQARVLE